MSKDKELFELKNKLKEYELVTRAVYELVNTNSLQGWNDSYAFGEGLDAVITLQTLVESSQDIQKEWNYHEWCEWVKTYKPENLEK